ncbi:MAG: helix-turn-helix domain-containing protein [Opitutaceae bacterium]|jgi:DNA-binding IclR family transcriptional regulator
MKQDKSVSSSLIKALDLIGFLTSHPGGLRLADLVGGSGLPRSTALRILQTIIEYGLIEKHDGRYRLSDQFYAWASRDRYEKMKMRYRPLLEAIAARVHELVLIGVREGGAIVHIDFVQWDNLVRVAPAPVTRHRPERHALGKLAMSIQPGILEKTRDAKLRKELEAIQRTGVAWNRGESDPDMVALATWGFRKTTAEPMIAVAWPKFRFQEKAANGAIRAIREIVAEYAGKERRRPALTE